MERDEAAHAVEKASTTEGLPISPSLGPTLQVIGAARQAADYVEQIVVGSAALRPVVTLNANQTIGEIRTWLDSGAPEADHQGYPVMDGDTLKGVITRRDITSGKHGPEARLSALIARPPVVISPRASLREVADAMVREGIGRLPVVDDGKLVGIVTRSDVLEVHKGRIAGETLKTRVRGPKLRALRPSP